MSMTDPIADMLARIRNAIISRKSCVEVPASRMKGHIAGILKDEGFIADFRQIERKPVDTCANYLLTYRPYLHYDDYLARGLPIASGVIEGACRHLVKDRMDLTGARWSLAGAEAVLRLRALRASQDFNEYWCFHEQQEHQRNHVSRYAHGAVPPVVQKRPRTRPRSHLKVVK